SFVRRRSDRDSSLEFWLSKPNFAKPSRRFSHRFPVPLVGSPHPRSLGYCCSSPQSAVYYRCCMRADQRLASNQTMQPTAVRRTVSLLDDGHTFIASKARFSQRWLILFSLDG